MNIEIESYKVRLDLLINKKNALQNDLVSAYDSEKKFALNNQIFDLEKQIDELKHKISVKPVTKFITDIPPRPEYFIGREEKLDEIAKNLNSAQPLMLINGVGGIGKSTIALEFANNPKYNSQYNYIAWFVVKNNLLADFVSAFFRIPEIRNHIRQTAQSGQTDKNH
jgi:hypothetical protein